MMSAGAERIVNAAVSPPPRTCGVRRRLTLVAVGPGESRLARAAEVPGGPADAASVGAAHVGGDVPRPLPGVVGRHGDGAAVDHCGRRLVVIWGLVRAAFAAASARLTSALVRLAVVLQLRAGFPLVVVGATAAEVARRQAAAARRVPARVGAARVLLDLREAGQRSETRRRRGFPGAWRRGWGRHLAGGASEAGRTLADEAAREGVAAPAVPARGAGAAVPPQLAAPTHEPRRAGALVPSGRVLKARAISFYWAGSRPCRSATRIFPGPTLQLPPFWH